MKSIDLPSRGLITDTHRRQFDEQGFFVLERVIPDDYLAMLREECGHLRQQLDDLADAAGRPHTTKYFFSVWDQAPGVNPLKDAARERIRDFVFSDLMAGITQALLGDNVYLFYEQFVVKAAEKGGTFAWHQDSAYVPFAHRPYLTCWCTLDDVTEENSTVYMLPYDRAGTREVVPHTQLETDWDLVGYRGDDPGVPVICPAGSIALFSSVCLHRSGANTTPHPRRIYLPQYSAEPITNPNGRLHNIAEPVVQEGRVVAART